MKFLIRTNPQPENIDDSQPICETAYELRYTPHLKYYLRKECVNCTGITPECTDYSPAVLK